MSEPRYVQHMSGQGKKWLVEGEFALGWEARTLHENVPGLLGLPKSEYRLCEPPEQWMDVTEQVQWSDPDNKLVSDSGAIDIIENGKLLRLCLPPPGYRFRKVRVLRGGGHSKMFAFIVERRQP